MKFKLEPTIDVKHMAKLANLNLSEEDIKKYSNQLKEVLDYVKQLERVDVKGIDPTSQVTGLVNIKREDESTPALSSEEVLANAPARSDSLFKVEAVFDDEN